MAVSKKKSVVNKMNAAIKLNDQYNDHTDYSLFDTEMNQLIFQTLFEHFFYDILLTMGIMNFKKKKKSIRTSVFKYFEFLISLFEC